VERRKIISASNVVLHNSKRAIFSLHRGDTDKAKEALLEIEGYLRDLEKSFGAERLAEEGAFRAGAEEYAEAKFFYLVTEGEEVDEVKNINLGPEIYLGGICDLTGELVRRAINMAAAGKPKEAEKMKELINGIMEYLVELDLTGYLRTKYDQAKNNLKKIEHIDYEIKLRKR